MSFKGLDFGQAMSGYNNLMAQGYRDRAELEQQNMALARQLQQQEFQNTMAAQQAAAQGFGYERPELLKQYGVSNLPVNIEAPEVQQFMAQNPNAVQDGRANPYDAKRLQEEIQTRERQAALLERQKLIESGKNARVGATKIAGDKIAARQAITMQIKSIENQLAKMNDPVKRQIYDYDAKKRKVDLNQVESQLKSQLATYYGQLQSLGNPGASGSFGPEAAPQQKTVSKRLYSPSRNQTKLVYSDGSEEIVNGKQ